MKKVILFTIVSVIGLVIFISCNQVPNRGMETDNPSNVLVELIKQYLAGEDFINLCSIDLNERDVRKTLDDWKSCGGWYSIVEGNDIFKQVTGGVPSLADNEVVLGFYGGRGDIFNMNGKGFAILSQDKKGKYVIKRILFKR